jgi:hypothetical protein
VYPFACPEQLDVELRDRRIRLPDLLRVHRATIWAFGLVEPAGPGRDAGAAARRRRCRPPTCRRRSGRRRGRP